MFEVVSNPDDSLTNLSNVHSFANAKLQEYGLDKLGWTFRLNTNKRRLGVCKYGPRIIEFSEHYIHNDWAEVQDTILHEIAHALVGPNHGHDTTWMQKCVEIGAKPRRLAPPTATSSAVHNWVIECPRCHRQWLRHRLKDRMHGARCPRCKVEVEIYRKGAI